jgi:hypothetical protein
MIETLRRRRAMVYKMVSRKETVMFLLKYVKLIDTFLTKPGHQEFYKEDAWYKALGYSQIVDFIMKICELSSDGKTTDRVYNTLNEYCFGKHTAEEVYRLFTA